jgi:hypothetical protein
MDSVNIAANAIGIFAYDTDDLVGCGGVPPYCSNKYLGTICGTNEQDRDFGRRFLAPNFNVGALIFELAK